MIFLHDRGTMKEQVRITSQEATMRLITRVLDPFTGRRDIFIRVPFTGRIIMIGG